MLVFFVDSVRSFEVLEADTRLSGQIYLLDADIVYELSEPALAALHNGVPLTFSLEMEVLREREWIWDETVASLEQRLRLEHHALTRQYVVTNLNSGVTTTFPTLAAATAFLGEVRDFPLLDAAVLEGEGKYSVQLRVSLEIESLPAPLRPVAYLSGDWRLTSEWYQWPL
jgi:hypothetical protein